MKAIWMLVILYIAGCSSTATVFMQEDHPAHPEAASARYQPVTASLTGVHDPMGMVGAPMTETHSDEDLPEAIMAALGGMVEAYLKLSEQLADDQTGQLQEQAPAITAQLSEMTAISVPGDDHFWHRNMEATEGIAGAVGALMEVEDLKKARVHFAALSRHMRELLAETGFPKGFDDTAYEYTCSMYKDAGEVATWIQLGENVANPYFGSMMRSCSTGKKALSEADSDESAGQHEHHGH